MRASCVREEEEEEAGKRSGGEVPEMEEEGPVRDGGQEGRGRPLSSHVKVISLETRITWLESIDMKRSNQASRTLMETVQGRRQADGDDDNDVALMQSMNQ